jgi:hypothetical protein
VLVIVLAIGGWFATKRRTESRSDDLYAQLREADEALALAHAEDKGWERGRLEEAARALFAETYAGERLEALQLVQVVDRPGTDEDQAVFRAITDGGERTLTLGRRDGAWVAA